MLDWAQGVTSMESQIRSLFKLPARFSTFLNNLLDKAPGLSGPPPTRVYFMIRGKNLIRGGYDVGIEAKIMKLRFIGWMRTHDAFIELDLEGDPLKVDELMESFRMVPTMCSVLNVEMSKNMPLKNFKYFRRRSA